MIPKERVATIFKLAYPICIALSSAVVMSLVDLAMVRPLGNQAIAAVGLSMFSNSLILSFVMGIAPAVQGMVARRRGEGSTEAKCLPLNGGLLAAVVVGAPLTVICYLATPYFFSLISSDPDVTRIGVPFLRTLYLAIIATGMNAAFRGHWAGMEKPKVYMTIVVVMNCLNFFGNYVLIYGRFGAPVMGATGAALSTMLAVHAGALINGVIIYLHYRKDGFLKAKPARALLIRIFKIGMPATMQEFFLSAGFIVFFWMVGQVGTAELAAANVLIRITMVLSLFAMALGVASATLVSRNVGKGDLEEAARWGWDVGKVGVLGITALGLPLFLFPEAILSLFLSNPNTIAMAVVPLRMVAATTGAGSLIYIFAYTLFSVGDGNRVLLVSFSTQWIVFLPAVWIVGPYLRYGLLQIWLVQMVYGALATVLITAIWADGRWKKIRI
ncbi:MAG TPA: MATE family efflux transporter [Thermoanaerobaculia bacterium]|nr:MATE family efflux transporter [Thermoanaerobaculia bacterium]